MAVGRHALATEVRWRRAWFATVGVANGPGTVLIVMKERSGGIRSVAMLDAPVSLYANAASMTACGVWVPSTAARASHPHQRPLLPGPPTRVPKALKVLPSIK